jgi:prepilin-type N-terminal cleavage/methylation domain-containing protein
MMKMLRKQEGFTLIELLIDVIILGILMVVAIPKFMNNRVKSEYNACRTNIRMINDAVTRYQYDTAAGNVDMNNTELNTKLVNGIDVGNQKNVKYMSSMPYCPSRNGSGTHYTYDYKAASGANCGSGTSIDGVNHNDANQSFS